MNRRLQTMTSAVRQWLKFEVDALWRRKFAYCFWMNFSAIAVSFRLFLPFAFVAFSPWDSVRWSRHGNLRYVDHVRWIRHGNLHYFDNVCWIRHASLHYPGDWSGTLRSYIQCLCHWYFQSDTEEGYAFVYFRLLHASCHPCRCTWDVFHQRRYTLDLSRYYRCTLIFDLPHALNSHGSSNRLQCVESP